MHSVIINKKRYKLPANWSELSEEKLCKIIYHIISETGSDIYRKLNTLGVFIKFNRRVIKSIAPVNAPLLLKLITPVQMYSLMELTDWLFNTFPDSPTIKAFRILGTKYIAPKAKLSNCVFVEFAFADSYFEKYISTRDIKDLNKLIACLYRPRKNLISRIFKPFCKDQRVAFDDSQIERHANKIDRFISLEKRFCILLFYIGCRKFMSKQFAVLFESDFTDDPELPEEMRAQLKEQQKQKSKEYNFGWHGLLNNISKSGQYGDYEKTKYADLHTVLYNLCIDLIQAKNREDKNVNH
jgi:hypothetical protein